MNRWWLKNTTCESGRPLSYAIRHPSYIKRKRRLHWVRKLTQGSSSGATLNFGSWTKREGGQPRYLIIQEVAVHFRTSPSSSPNLLLIQPPLSTSSQTPKVDPKHWVLATFCIGKSLFATCRKLRTYQCFCPVLLRKQCKHRGFCHQNQKSSQIQWFWVSKVQKNSIYSIVCPETCKKKCENTTYLTIFGYYETETKNAGVIA